MKHLGWLALAVALATYLFLQVLPYRDREENGRRVLASHANDFKHLYLGSWLLANGENPYDAATMLRVAGEWSEREDPRFRTVLPFVYPPFTGIVLRPLTWWRFTDSVQMWQIVNHVLLIGAAIILAMLAPPGRRVWFAAIGVGMLALSAPASRNTNAGQLNAVLTFGYAAVAALLAAGAESRVCRFARSAAGVLVAALAWFKLAPGLLLLPLLFRKDRTAIVPATAGMIAIPLLTLALVPLSTHLAFLPELHAMGYGRSTWEDLGQTFWRDPYNQSANALFHRTLVAWPGYSPIVEAPRAVAQALSYTVGLGVLGLLARGLWRARRALDSREGSLFGIGATVCASLLIPSLLWDHYLVQMLVPSMLWGRFAFIRRASAGEWSIALVALALAALPIPFEAEFFRSGTGLLLGSVKLLSPVLLFGLCLRSLGRVAKEATAP